MTEVVTLIVPAQNPCPLFSHYKSTFQLEHCLYPVSQRRKQRSKELNHLYKANQLKVWSKDEMIQVLLYIIPANYYSQTRTGHSGSCDCNLEIQPVPSMLSLAHAHISGCFMAFKSYIFFCHVLPENGLRRLAACCKLYLPRFSEPQCWKGSWWSISFTYRRVLYWLFNIRVKLSAYHHNNFCSFTMD